MFPVVRTTFPHEEKAVLATGHKIEIRKKAREEWLSKQQTALEEADPTTKITQITTVSTIHFGRTPTFCKLNTKSNKAHVKQAHGQCQSIKFGRVTQMGRFQVEAIAFHVTEHFLGPHPVGIKGHDVRRRR